ncbi:DUF4349 domain-containing protein [Leptospira langatensis]|uniref:DUF4349 domain-containing protein n=1 Tax=Leptospira langatensis TaxID=2484983 RepID=A0A5F1ZYI7_9LEPT|nr:DUF4349 domain-containing protein [Leptospira langatensis]TGK00166.1 DUF4349 domain-containing protein [Leptospira langatensis]TGL42802.1 DUF4349 domain-containing protein [Leptospira langatensis]
MKKSLIFLFLLSALIVCKGEKQNEEQSAVAGESAKKSTPTPSAVYREKEALDDLKTGKDADGTQEQFKPFFSAKTGTLKIGRLLEYKVDLAFQTKDFGAARRFLLQLSDKYGFVQSTNFDTYLDVSSPTMTVVIHVKSSDLYQVLLELDKLGTLTHENIQVEDHTEAFELEKIHARREKTRMVRRGELVSRLPSKGAVEAEELLGQSEDAADSAEFEKWKILDRVQWAKISIRIDGPEKPKGVEVPNFKDVFTDLIELFLRLIVLLIYSIPFLILATGAFFLFRFARNRWFKKN